MARPLLFVRDFGGYPSTGSSTAYESPEWTQTVLLTSDTVQAITVPVLDGTFKLIAYFQFEVGATLLYCPTATPTLTLPTGTVTLSTNEILIPGGGRIVVGGQDIQVMSAGSDLNLVIAYYQAAN